MNRAELVDAIADATGQTKLNVQHSVAALIHTITSAVSRGDRVTLVGFGTFERRNRRARTGVNPQNPSKKLKIAAAKVPAFRPGQQLKDVVNGKAKLGSLATEKASTGAKSKKKAAPKKAAAKKPAASSKAKKKGRR